jgi:hypothetical protein
MARSKKYVHDEYALDHVAVHHQLQQLERKARTGQHSIVTLGDASFWMFKNGLNRAMKDVHGVVRQRLDEIKPD